MQIIKSFFLTIVIASFLTSCNDAPPIEVPEDINSEYVPNEKETAFEELIFEIDANDSLLVGQSLFYSREGGASVEVEIKVNDSNQMVKMVEEYTTEEFPSIASNTFYFKNRKMNASKELMEEAVGDSSQFIERVTYYDENENPIITKKKAANFEEELEFESYQIVENQKCSYDRALEVLNQENEYATTFQGFVKEDPYLYLIVGENKEDGYYTSVVVQYMTSLIKKLQQDEKSMLGTPLEIEYETLNGDQGYEYQILMGVRMRGKAGL